MSVAENIDNATSSAKGWQAELQLGFVNKQEKTVLAFSKHFGPLRVQRPFYPEGEVCHVYLLHPPGGVVGGDELNIQIRTENNSHALITAPGATKFYRSLGELAKVTQRLDVGSNSILEWFPQENILFPGAKIKLQTLINLDPDATFIGWDICCLGRPVNDEIFDTGQYDSTLKIERGGTPLFIERQRVFEPRHLTAAAGLRGYPMTALFICTPCNEQHIELARQVVNNIKPDFPVGITLIDDILILRALGNSSENLQATMIPIWQTLRPLLCNKQPILPRIWLT